MTYQVKTYPYISYSCLVLLKQGLALKENVVLMFSDGEESFSIFGSGLKVESFSVIYSTEVDLEVGLTSESKNKCRQKGRKERRKEANPKCVQSPEMTFLVHIPT